MIVMTLPQLAQAAARVVSGVDQASGRVREVPDVRTIRYYTTLGLLDRAAEMRGRTALYGERHLFQLVAIKRLQAEGLTLENIQQRLLGITADALGALARVPDVVEPVAVEPIARKPRADFWRQRPVAHRTMQTIELAPGTLLTTDTPYAAEQQQALLEAAQPLLRWLEDQRGKT